MSASWNCWMGTLPSMSALRPGNTSSCSSGGRFGSSHCNVNSAMLRYHQPTDSQMPLSSACCIESAQCTIVYAATLLVDTSDNGFASGWFHAARYASICDAIFSRGCMIENDSKPRWFMPATVDEPSVVAAIQHGGCGYCTGLGVTMRRANWNVGLSHSK